MYLDFGQDGDDRDDDAEDEVEADEDLVFSAVVRLGVVHVEQHDRCERQRVVEDREGQQA